MHARACMHYSVRSSMQCVAEEMYTLYSEETYSHIEMAYIHKFANFGLQLSHVIAIGNLKIEIRVRFLKKHMLRHCFAHPQDRC